MGKICEADEAHILVSAAMWIVNRRRYVEADRIIRIPVSEGYSARVLYGTTVIAYPLFVSDLTMFISIPQPIAATGYGGCPVAAFKPLSAEAADGVMRQQTAFEHIDRLSCIGGNIGDHRPAEAVAAVIPRRSARIDFTDTDKRDCQKNRPREDIFGVCYKLEPVFR